MIQAGAVKMWVNNKPYIAVKFIGFYEASKDESAKWCQSPPRAKYEGFVVFIVCKVRCPCEEVRKRGTRGKRWKLTGFTVTENKEKNVKKEGNVLLRSKTGFWPNLYWYS